MNHNDVNKKFHKYSKLEKVLRSIGYASISDYTTEVTNKDIPDDINSTLHKILNNNDLIMQGDSTFKSNITLLRKCLDALNVPYTMVHRRDGNYLRLVEPTFDLSDYIKNTPRGPFLEGQGNLEPREPLDLDKFYLREIVEYDDTEPLQASTMLPYNGKIHFIAHKYIHKVPFTVNGYTYIELPRFGDIVYNVRLDALTSTRKVISKGVPYEIAGFRPVHELADTVRHSIVLHSLPFIRAYLKVKVSSETGFISVHSNRGYLSLSDRNLIGSYGWPNSMPIHPPVPIEWSPVTVVKMIDNVFTFRPFERKGAITGISVKGNFDIRFKINDKTMPLLSIYNKDGDFTYLDGVDKSNPIWLDLSQLGDISIYTGSSELKIIYDKDAQ